MQVDGSLLAFNYVKLNCIDLACTSVQLGNKSIVEESLYKCISVELGNKSIVENHYVKTIVGQHTDFTHLMCFCNE